MKHRSISRQFTHAEGNNFPLCIFLFSNWSLCFEQCWDSFMKFSTMWRVICSTKAVSEWCKYVFPGELHRQINDQLFWSSFKSFFRQKNQTFTNSIFLNMLVFAAIYDNKLRLFGFWTVGWTNDAISRHHFEHFSNSFDVLMTRR